MSVYERELALERASIIKKTCADCAEYLPNKFKRFKYRLIPLPKCGKGGGVYIEIPWDPNEKGCKDQVPLDAN